MQILSKQRKIITKIKNDGMERFHYQMQMDLARWHVYELGFWTLEIWQKASAIARC